MLKKGSKLVAFAEKSPVIASLQSYEPGLRDALRLATEIGSPLGLRASRDAATALFEAAGGDRTLIRRELEKLSLYLDAAEDRPKPLERSDVEAIGVGVGDADQFALGGAVASGRPALVADLLGRLPAGMGIPALRAVERRFGLLLTLRGVVDGGASPQTAVDSARPPIFWKEKDAVAAELRPLVDPDDRSRAGRSARRRTRYQIERQPGRHRGACRDLVAGAAGRGAAALAAER